ncbi:MAG TPA: hypothetical protein VGQ76_08950 [Thermoanaerobaculia bacterium]|nr:hypothetical protein [Thermoanaerobaculia bacterium]
MHKVLLAFALLTALPVVAQTPKQPWEWTDAERIAALTDDTAVAARLRAYRASQPPAATFAVEGIANDPIAGVYDRIEGRRDPHLFFRSDLLDMVATMAYADESMTRNAYRHSKEDALEALGLPADFWETLEVITAAYRADRKDEKHNAFSDRSEAEKNAGQEVIYARMCRDRRAALREAEERFGPKFVQFLYTAVAPTMTRTILRKIDPEELRRVTAEECE